MSKFLDSLSNNTPNSDMFERSLSDIKEELNEQYPILIKTLHNKKLTQAQKKQAAMEFTALLEEFVETFEKNKK